MLRVLEKLNNPKVVVGVLLVILLANGFLLYQQQRFNPAPPEEANVVNEQNRDTPPGEDKPDKPKPPEENTARPDETAAEETTAPEETTGNESTGSDASDDNQNSPSSDDSDGDQSGNGDSSDGVSGSRDEPDAPVLAGLTNYVRECDSETEECIRDYMSEELPRTNYVGGRTDLGSGSNGSNRNVIYFEDPDLATCDYEREVYEAENSREYVVILIGPGSFSNERGDECIPQA